MLNMATLLSESAKKTPNKACLIINDVTLTYGEVDMFARKLAGSLKQMGVTRGTHVALMLPNVPHFTIAYYAIHYAGGVVVPLNVLLTPDEVTYHLEDSNAQMLFAWEGFLDSAKGGFDRVDACAHLVVAKADRTDFTAPEGAHNMTVLIGGGEAVQDIPNTMPDDTAVILYTSGTTGKPKGAELSQFNLFFNTTYVVRFLVNVDQDAVSLASLPLFHSFGQTVIQNATIMAGGTVILMPRFEPQAAFTLMQKHRVTIFGGVPTMYFALLNYPEADAYELSLKYCICGGSAMPVQVMNSFDERYGVNILEGYGLSETSPVASFNVLDRPKKPGSIGIPIWGVEFKLVDDDDQTIDKVGERGEICIKGHNVMKGYYKKPEANAEAFKGGWFHTGDIAERDEDGYYFIVDRKKDMIIRGGFNVYPREIEEVLYTHAAIAEAAVVGVAHESHGEEVKAVVAFKPGQSAGEDEIQAFCKEKLAAYKYPRIIQIMDALPKGPTGKILKRELRD